MQRGKEAMCLLLVVVLLVVGCNGDDSSPTLDTGLDTALADAAVDTGASVDLVDLQVDVASPDASQGTVTVKGIIGLMSTKQGVDGVTICKYLNGQKTSACTQSDATGMYSIDVPANADTGITYEKSGIFNIFLTLNIPPATVDYNIATLTDSEAIAELTPLGVTYPDPANGALSVNGTEGAVLSVTPATGIGPFYLDQNGNLSQTATAMAAPIAAGMVFGLPPGVYEVDVTHPTKTCTPAGGWPSVGSHTVRVPVLAGFRSSTATSCK